MNLTKYKKNHNLEEILYTEFCCLKNLYLLKMQLHDDVHHIEDLIDKMR